MDLEVHPVLQRHRNSLWHHGTFCRSSKDGNVNYSRPTLFAENRFLVQWGSPSGLFEANFVFGTLEIVLFGVLGALSLWLPIMEVAATHTCKLQ